MKTELSWREIFDCKIPGTTREQVRYAAKDAWYKYFCHNGRIYGVKDNCAIKCIRGSVDESNT